MGGLHMDIETLTADAAVLSLSAAELPREDCSRFLCELVRKAQKARGLSVWENMEASLFVSGARALLLAWPTETVLFAFDDFEALLRASLACGEGLRSALTYLDGTWYLYLRCARGRVPAALGEFGERRPGSDRLLAHLCEQGSLIIPENAVDVLRKHFA